MFRIVSNSKQVAFQIDRSLRAKKRGINTAIDNTLKKIYFDARSNAASNDAFEKSELVEAIEYNPKLKIVGVLNKPAYYAPFIEFGTKSKTNIPTELAGIASSYRGKRPDVEDLVSRIEEAGFDKEKAKAIAWAILKKGLSARPFFYPAVFQNQVFLKQQLKAALKKRV